MAAAIPGHVPQLELAKNVIEHIEANKRGEWQLFLTLEARRTFRVNQVNGELYPRHLYCSALLPGFTLAVAVVG
ncbi:hypothetical protein [Candidatus Laterigemmans baculatus]|uniref:hypothetical protein n=1 Tax=Candidatus Laterigemmans baculatus TaxID=2770505 RepID=UPI0013DAE4EC|nr:hypothetical protein [Candidatus Laterigemmans baculatus]